MLLFQGITINAGKRERFCIEYKLQVSYIAAYRLLAKYELDTIAAVDAIQDEIKAIYQDNKNLPIHEGKKRFLVAIKIRTKELLMFFQRHNLHHQLLWQTLKILVKAISVRNKWEELEKLCSTQNFCKKFLDDQKNRDFFEDYILFIRLCFLNQIKEPPPVNLQLHFVNAKFPQCNWVVTDYSEKLKNKEWFAKEECCNSDFLRMRLLRCFNKPDAINIEQTPSKNSIAETVKLKAIRLSYKKQEKQAKLFESQADEVMRLFIQDILSEYPNKKGINHLIAILYQIQNNYQDGTCIFDWQKHFNLILKPKRAVNLKLQSKIAQDIFDKLQKLKVIRVFQKKEHSYEEHSSLIVILKNIYFPEQQYLKKDLQQNTMQLQIDSTIISNQNNHLNFSVAVRFLPVALLQESERAYPFLLLLCIYLYDCWIYEYPKLRGNIKKKIKEMIAGSYIKTTENGKYRIAQRIRSALQYLKQKNYIGNYQIQNSSQNILETIYLLSAPLEFHQKIAHYHYQKITDK